MNSRTPILIVAGLVAGLTSTASAWTTYGDWNSNMVQMRASAVSFPPANPFRIALGTVETRIFNNPSEAWIDQTYEDFSVGFNNGQSEVWFSSSVTYRPAVTFPEFNWLNGHINEADVVFYNGDLDTSTAGTQDFTTSMTKSAVWAYGGNDRPFEPATLHEYGHVLGLDHEDDEYNIMGVEWNHIHLNGTTCRSYLGEDAADGLIALYGRASGGSFEDVSVTHWKYDGPNGNGYSDHKLCKMYTTSGSTIGSSSYDGQRRYNVNAGQTLKVEFSYENNGETSQQPEVGFYISTNNYISAGDDLIATDTMTVNRNGVYTKKTTVTIPSDLNSGQIYYLGAYIDHDNDISETTGSNNRAYHIIKVN